MLDQQPENFKHPKHRDQYDRHQQRQIHRRDLILPKAKDTELAGPAFSRLESGVALRKGEPELLAAINKAIDKLKADGTLAKLSEKYFGADVTK